MNEFESTWEMTGTPVSHRDSKEAGTFAVASDYQQSAYLKQSGLSYTFQDGQPILPAQSGQFNFNLAMKRVMDIVGAVCGLLVLLPILLGIALIIRVTSKGPAVFRQQRLGKNGKVFQVYKFRTMYTDRCDISGVQQTIQNDPRVTWIGRILRKYNIDELPQLINVIRGEMSLVGPRPHAIGMLAAGVTYETLVPYYPLRYTMRPGLTGWAQANGYRGPTDDAQKAKARIDHDIAYIQNFSVWLDIRTLGRTVIAEFRSPNGF